MFRFGSDQKDHRTLQGPRAFDEIIIISTHTAGQFHIIMRDDFLSDILDLPAIVYFFYRLYVSITQGNIRVIVRMAHRNNPVGIDGNHPIHPKT